MIVEALIEALHFFPRGMTVMASGGSTAGLHDVGLKTVRIDTVAAAPYNIGRYEKAKHARPQGQRGGAPSDALLIDIRGNLPHSLMRCPMRGLCINGA